MLTNRGPWLLVATGSLGLLLCGACSSSSPRDQNWGSDIGRDDGSVGGGGSGDAAAEQAPAETSEIETSAADALADTATETMDDGAVNAQDTLDLDAVDGGETQ